MNWRSPPSIGVVGGDETFLREREIRRAVLIASKKHKVVHASSDAEVVDAITVGSTFGEPTFIVVSSNDVEDKTVTQFLEHPSQGVHLLVRLSKAIAASKWAPLQNIHASNTIEFNTPTTYKGKVELATRFCRAEAKPLGKDALPLNLAKALVKAVGTDLGTLHYEMVKVTSLCKFYKRNQITAQDLRATIKPSFDVNIAPLKEAMVHKNRTKMLSSLEKLKRVSSSDPVMLLMRAPNGPAQLAARWLHVSILLEKGVDPSSISVQLKIPEWLLKKETIPACKRWGKQSLRLLVRDLARVDRGVFKGAPNPWVACVNAILLHSE